MSDEDKDSSQQLHENSLDAVPDEDGDDDAARMKEKDEKDDAARKKLAEWLAGSIAVATAFGAFIGVTGPDLHRIVENETDLFRIAAVLLLVALLLGLVAVLWRRFAVALLVVGLLAFVASMTALVEAKSESVGKQERPTVVATFDKTDSTLKVVLTAGGLASEDYVHLVVQGLNARNVLSDMSPAYAHTAFARVPVEYFTQLLYRSRVGPDPEGDVTLTFEVPVPAGLYDKLQVLGQILDPDEDEIEIVRFQCDALTKKVTCVTMTMPTPALPIDDARVLALQQALDHCMAEPYLYLSTELHNRVITKEVFDAAVDGQIAVCNRTVLAGPQ